MLVEIFALAVIIVCAYLIYRMLSEPEAVEFSKKREGAKAAVLLKANKAVLAVRLYARLGEGDLLFERKRIDRGQTIEFSYPYSPEKVKMVVDLASGEQKVFEF